MNESNPYAPPSTNVPSTQRGSFVHALITAYAFLCSVFVTFIGTAIAILHPAGLDLLPNSSLSVQFVLTVFSSFAIGSVLAFFTWRLLRKGILGSLAAVAIATTMFTLSFVGIALVLQIVLGNFQLVPEERSLLSPAHYAMNLFAGCAGISGSFAIFIELRMHRRASALVVAMCTLSCLLFMSIFLGLLLW